MLQGDHFENITGRRDTSRYGLGVVSSEVSPSDDSTVVWATVKMPPFALRYIHHFGKRSVKSDIRVTMTAEAYVKEPHVDVSLIGYHRAEMLDRNGLSLRPYDLKELPDPWRHTFILRDGRRRSVAFYGQGRPPLHIRVNREGWDRWREDADKAPRAPGHNEPYCFQGKGGTLSLGWEIARRRKQDHAALMIHSWRNGTGGGDCPGTARLLKVGKSYSVSLEVSR